LGSPPFFLSAIPNLLFLETRQEQELLRNIRAVGHNEIRILPSRKGRICL
jgi:hypothetical protein